MGEHGSTLRQVASFPDGDVLNPTPVFAWFLIRLERVTEERLDPSQEQRDCRYDAGSQSGLGECLEMLLYICEQKFERAAMMIMGHDPSRDAPEPWECRFASGS